jgi:hypothetical protein
MGMRWERGRGVTRLAIGAFLVVGTAVGCKAVPTAGSPPVTAVTTAGVPTHGTHTARPHPTSKPSGTRSPTAAPSPSVSATPSGGAPSMAPPSSPPSTASAPATDPATPAPSQSQVATGDSAFTANCPAHASSSVSGCGSWDAGPSSGQAPGFAAGQQSSPNLLGVNQDPWTASQGMQALRAASFQDWSVTATDTDPGNAPGEVLTYPDASFNYYELDSAASNYTTPPAQYDLNNITSLTSDFTESMPQVSNLNAEAAYDLWLNNWKTEIMVWVDTSPAKDRNLADDGMTRVGAYTYGGQNFALWRSGSGITGFYVFLLDHNETSGSVNLKAMLQTMVSLGYIPSTSPLTQIPFGWEISDTGGKPVTFSLSRFDVSLAN